MSRSGYYYFIQHEQCRIDRDKASLKVVRKYFDESRSIGGIQTIDMMIRNSNEHDVINHKKVARLKREYGLITKIRRKNPYKHFPVSEHSEVPNLLARDFVYPIPDQVYSTDMTYLFYEGGSKAYLSATKDLATNEIVSHQVMSSPVLANFAGEFRRMLEAMPESKRKSLIIHSDQGFQYTHSGFRDLLMTFGVTQSMSRKGNCHDNAPIESFFGHFKDSLELKGCKTIEDVRREVERKMYFYNYRRPQKGLNKKPPAEYRGLISGLF